MSETAKVIEAEKFVLRDSKGRRRAELGVQSDDNPELLLLSDHEQPQARFGIADGAATIGLLNGQGIPRVTVRAGLGDAPGAGPSITLSREDGTSAIFMSVVDVLKASVLQIYDAAGTARVRIRMDEDGKSGFEILDAERHIRLTIVENGLYMQDEHGQYRVKMILDAMGPTIGVSDPSGNPRGALAVSDELGTAHLILSDAEAKVRVNAVVHRDGSSSITGGLGGGRSDTDHSPA